MSDFSIPPEFQDELELVPVADYPGDAAVLDELSTFRSVTSEKNIWAFWDSGIRTMPPWCLRNVLGWYRICSPDWTIRVLDNIPGSPNYALNYIPSDSLPDCFVQKTMNGSHNGQHSADFVRSASILHHGGAFSDVGSMMIRHMDRICWDILMDESRPERVCVPLLHDTNVPNYFVAARKGDPFIRAWHELFCHLWKGKTSSAGLLDDPILSSMADSFDFAPVQAAGMNIAFKVDPRAFFEYVTQIICWQRLCQLDYPVSTEPNDAAATDEPAFSPAQYWRTSILAMHSIHETLPLETATGFADGGQPIVDVLSTRLDADPESEAYKKAKDAVWSALARGSLQKVLRGTNLTVEATLGALLDAGKDVDCKEGTFGWLFREGAVRTRQKRAGVEEIEKGIPKVILKKGLLEA